jgi:hypothetical protein
MKSVSRHLLKVGIALALTGMAGMFAAKDLSAQAQERLAYSCKFVCGTRTSDVSVVRGVYETTCNIHNPHFVTAQFQKKAVIALPQSSPPGRISPFVTEVLTPDQALGVNCRDIRALFPPPAVPAFIEGFLVIYVPGTAAGMPPLELDVVGVRTARPRQGTSADVSIYDVSSIDVERVVPIRAVPAP